MVSTKMLSTNPLKLLGGGGMKRLKNYIAKLWNYAAAYR